METEKVLRFYENWEDPKINWPHMGMKQIKLDTGNGTFISLNKFRNRVGFRQLKEYGVQFRPRHIYMSVLNWLMPERVGPKRKCSQAYPVGGEYVLDLDHYLSYFPHGHRTEPEGFCYHCLKHIK